jgi:transposase-like protein
MARRKRNESPERQALKKMMAGYLKENPVRNGNDVNAMMREMMSVIIEEALYGELDDELGYSKYDYKNKDTGNSRNVYSKKTMHTSYGDMDLEIPRDRNGEYEPQVIKKYQNTIIQDMEEKIISMYAKWSALSPSAKVNLRLPD